MPFGTSEETIYILDNLGLSIGRREVGETHQVEKMFGAQLLCDIVEDSRRNGKFNRRDFGPNVHRRKCSYPVWCKDEDQ